MTGDAVEFRPLDRSRGPELLAINRACPIVADFTFLFDRAPDFFAWPDAVFDEHRYLGMFDGGRMVGYGLAGFARGWLAGGPGTFVYGGDARVLPEARGRRLTLRAADAFLDLIPPAVDFGFGLVKEGNAPAEKVVDTFEHPSFERSPLARFEVLNLLLLWRLRSRGSFSVRRATSADVPAMAALLRRAGQGRLFGPVTSDEDLARSLERRQGLGAGRYYLAERAGALVGLFGAWDMDAIRRTAVLRYSARAEILRAAWSAARLILRDAAPLPRAGGALRTITVTDLAIPDRDPAILRELLAAASGDHAGRGYHLLHLGFAGADPLAEAVRGLPVQRFASQISLLRRAGAPEIDRSDPYIDLRMI